MIVESTYMSYIEVQSLNFVKPKNNTADEWLYKSNDELSYIGNS